MKKLTLNIWVLFTMTLSASLAITGCATAGGTRQGDSQVQKSVPGQANIDPRWKAGECNWSDMDIDTRKQCWAYVASQLPQLDPNHRELFGEQYDPHKFLKCRNELPRNASCDVYRLRRAENPEYWPNPDVPKPKWPEAPKESVYKFGMSSKDYFEALCKAEAGEFIYKTVENVEGIYQVRPRNREPDPYSVEDRYVMEDPYGYFGADRRPHDYYVQPYLGKYQFFETPLSMQNNVGHNEITRFYRDSNANPGKTYQSTKDGQFTRVPYLVTKKQASQINSRYGYVWRGIQRLHDRELGIAGGELAVIDLTTNEILALRRGFARSGNIRNNASGFWWMNADKCEQTSTIINGKQREKPDFWFIYDVLKPNPNINDGLEEIVK